MKKQKIRNLITKKNYEYVFDELQKLPKSIHHLIKYTNEKLKV